MNHRIEPDERPVASACFSFASAITEPHVFMNLLIPYRCMSMDEDHLATFEVAWVNRDLMPISVIEGTHSAEVLFGDTPTRQHFRAWVAQQLDLPLGNSSPSGANRIMRSRVPPGRMIS